MKKSKKRNGRLLLIILIVATLLGSSHIAGAEQQQVYHYVALGDSLSAGFEPWMVEEWESKKSFPTTYGYVERIYEQALYNGRADVENYGILGLKSEGLKNLLTVVSSGKVVNAEEIQAGLPDPRINEILAKGSEIKTKIEAAHLITITIGGNDVGDLYSWMQSKSDMEIQAEVEKRINTYAENLTLTLQMIYKLNPKGKVVIADQYQPYPKVGHVDTYTKLGQYSQAFTASLENVIATMQMSKEQLNIAYVAKRFVGYEVAFTYINLLELEKSDIHPNQKGYEEIARAFSETIWGTYKQVSHKNPIGIVVKGNELVTQYQPVIMESTTYVPVREYVEALGGQVDWDQTTQSAIANFNGIKVSYKVNSNLIDVNGVPVQMKVPVKVIKVDPNDKNGKTYVPLRALAEDGLKLDVQYIQKSNIAYINP